MSGVVARVEGHVGRITLDRPEALNALTREMCHAIERAVTAWADDPAVALVLIDAAPGRAFCAGGDLAALYEAGRAGDPGPARAFWADEYRLNARLARYPKPTAALLHGYVLGGGVGLGGHLSHRVVGESARIGMPECGIGLVPDVGGTLLLARAPGRLGEYLGLTGRHMEPGDAIAAGFADSHVPEAAWPDLIATLTATGDPGAIDAAAATPPPAPLSPHRAEIDALFAGTGVPAIVAALATAKSPFAAETLRTLERNSPLSMACTLALVRRARVHDTIEDALEHEFRFTWRAVTGGDLLEGIRATLIDKDRAPRWRHANAAAVGQQEVADMLAPRDDGSPPPEGEA